MHLVQRILLLVVFSVITAGATERSPEPKDEYLPGVALSQGVTEITGVAVSPLLGVSSVGAWRYWNTPAARRETLPWYAKPWVWGTGFALVLLCFLKDTLGTLDLGLFTGVLKKPLDMVELLENKLSALVASGAFVPLVAREMAVHLQAGRAVEVPTASLAAPAFTLIDVSWILIPASIMAFLAVWVCFHAINVLIVLSPFTWLDALLKLLRTGLLAMVGLIYLIAPWLAAVLCLAIIGFALWLAPAAMRLMIFGFRCAVDILKSRGGDGADPAAPHVFTFGAKFNLPPLTGGRLVRLEGGSLAFCYRPFCIFPTRTVPLTVEGLYVEKGLLVPALVQLAQAGSERLLFLLLPRHRGQEEAMVNSLKLQGVLDHAAARLYAALMSWIADIFRRVKAGFAGG